MVVSCRMELNEDFSYDTDSWLLQVFINRDIVKVTDNILADRSELKERRLLFGNKVLTNLDPLSMHLVDRTLL